GGFWPEEAEIGGCELVREGQAGLRLKEWVSLARERRAAPAARSYGKVRRDCALKSGSRWHVKGAPLLRRARTGRARRGRDDGDLHLHTVLQRSADGRRGPLEDPPGDGGLPA